MNGKTKATIWDVCKHSLSSSIALLFTIGPIAAAWLTLDGPLPLSDRWGENMERRVAQVEQEVDDAQAYFLGAELFALRKERREVNRRISTYERRQAEPPQELIDHRDILDRQIYVTEQRLRKVGVQP